MIEGSVVLPLWKSKYIAWLALEGLCRQQDVDFEWELIISEEIGDKETFGIDRIEEYRKRLEAVGCVRLDYTPLKHWISLGAKHKLNTENSSPSSELFYKTAADIYSGPLRLRRLHDLWKEHPEGDYFVPLSSLSYDLITGLVIMRALEKARLPTMRANDVTNLAMAAKILRDAAKIFDVDIMTRSVDNDIWRYCIQAKGRSLIVIKDFSDMWRGGLNVNGLNTISNRTRVFKIPNKNPAIVAYPHELNETIPQEIVDRLKECVKFLPLHSRENPSLCESHL